MALAKIGGGQANARRELRKLLGGFPSCQFRLESREQSPAKPSGIRAEWLRLVPTHGRPIRAILTGPNGEWRGLPAVLYCHAHGNRYGIGASELVEGRPALASPSYGEALARRGIVAMCIDLPCFGERSDATEAALAKRHLWQGRTLFGAMLAELLAALGVLERIEGVDAGRIGCMGISMGATLAFWLGALEPRIRAIAHLCSFADLTTLVDGGGHDLHGIYMTVPGLLRRFRTGQIAGLVAPRPQLACVGLQDPLTPEDAVDVALTDVREAYAAARAPHAFEVLLERRGGHQETSAMRRAVLQFLGDNL